MHPARARHVSAGARPVLHPYTDRPVVISTPRPSCFCLGPVSSAVEIRATISRSDIGLRHRTATNWAADARSGETEARPRIALESDHLVVTDAAEGRPLHLDPATPSVTGEIRLGGASFDVAQVTGKGETD